MLNITLLSLLKNQETNQLMHTDSYFYRSYFMHRNEDKPAQAPLFPGHFQTCLYRNNLKNKTKNQR